MVHERGQDVNPEKGVLEVVTGISEGKEEKRNRENCQKRGKREREIT